MSLQDWQVLRSGIWAAEEIAKRYGVEISKALNPLDPADFVTISARLAASLRFAVKGTESVALRGALDSLDVDWPNMSQAGRLKIIAAAKDQIGALESTIPKLVSPVLGRSAVALVSRTRIAAVAQFGFSAEIRSEAPIDRETVDNLPQNQMVYIKDQYGRRADGLDQIARETVASGLERGLGRDDISAEIGNRLSYSGVLRTENYWDLIAADFSNKARTCTQLNTFDRAGVQQFEFDAIMDQATSDICRLLHGRRFSVQKSQSKMQKSLSLTDPEQVKNSLPWVQSGTAANGDQILYYERNGTRTIVARVERSGIGESDRSGSYSSVLSNKALEAAGLPVPPRHGHCRSTIMAVV